MRTLVGKGLFEFGDRDGDFEAARLQHALGIVADDGGLIVADTFNDKLKRLDLVKREVVTLAGGDGALSEPGGLAWLADGGLLVADTNNHRLRRFAPATSVLGAFPVTGLSAPTTSGLILATGTASQRGHAAGARSVVATGKLGPGLGTLVVDVVAPTGGKLTAGAPIALTARAAGTGVSLPTPRQRHKLGEGVLPLRLPIQAAANAGGTIELTLEYFW